MLFFLCFTANLFSVCIAVSYVRQSLMEETRKLPLAFSVETLNPKQEEQLGQLMCVPRRGWQSLIRDDPL